MDILPVNHISLISEAEIKQICNPIFQNSPITYFYYGKTYNDGSMYVLPSNANWHHHCFSNTKLVEEAFDNAELRKNNYSLWANLIPQSLGEAREFYRIDHAILMIRQHKKFFEFFGFGGRPADSKVLDFYFNNMDILQIFITYFKDKAANLIELFDKKQNRIKLPNYYKSLN